MGIVVSHLAAVF